MAVDEQELLDAYEVHDIEAIRGALDAGLDLSAPIRGKLPVDWLIEMYFRSDRFPDCLRLLLDRGALLADPVIAPVLLNDADAIRAAHKADPALLRHRTSLNSTFTPLIGATLLHVAAEYGNLKAARVLVKAGADVNAQADIDDFGLNGHTPLFHTVNSNGNRSEPILRLLLDAGARSDIRLAGITWGKGFEWETTCFDVTPISYAQLGLLPQFHRRESDLYDNIRLLLEASNRMIPPITNVPNRYLQPKVKG